jgi:hypothetical protein
MPIWSKLEITSTPALVSNTRFSSASASSRGFRFLGPPVAAMGFHPPSFSFSFSFSFYSRLLCPVPHKHQTEKRNEQTPNLSNFLSLPLYDSNNWHHKLHRNKLQTAWRIRNPRVRKEAGGERPSERTGLGRRSTRRWLANEASEDEEPIKPI